ncbi:MAG: GNAT family N-acetyltransferase [Jiangellaceae bacterium]
MAAPANVHVRRYRSGDRPQAMALAPRLIEGVAPWRDPGAVLTAVHGWVRDSLDAAGRPDHAVYVATDGSGVVGVVTVAESAHFTGQVDAYVGELAVAAGMERRGIATRLMSAAEAWAAGRGLSFITLETGAANQPARSFYRTLGYREEGVRLTKPIAPAERRERSHV